MSGAERRQALDTRDRARIRAALKRYMKDHKIGVPALKFRIEDATQSITEFPLKTLQRFISDTHRTGDGYVAALHDFVKEVEYWREKDPVEEFGEAFFNFLQPYTGRSKAFDRCFLGTFLINESQAPLGEYGGGPVPADKRFRDTPETVGQMLFEWVENPAYVHALEQRPLKTSEDDPPNRRKTYEGVMISAGAHFHAVLRDTLTYVPRTYMLAPAKDLREPNETVDVFVGDCFAATISPRPPDQNQGFRHRYVHLCPEYEGRARQRTV